MPCPLARRVRYDCQRRLWKVNIQYPCHASCGHLSKTHRFICSTPCRKTEEVNVRFCCMMPMTSKADRSTKSKWKALQEFWYPITIPIHLSLGSLHVGTE